MSHYAILDDNNVVTNVIVVNDVGENGGESEELGLEACRRLFNNPDTKAVKTSYNDNIRVNFAAIGGTYDESLDAFIPPKPFQSWILNTNTCTWEPPVPRPPNSENGLYMWSEDSLQWIFIENVVEEAPPQ